MKLVFTCFVVIIIKNLPPIIPKARHQKNSTNAVVRDIEHFLHVSFTFLKHFQSKLLLNKTKTAN